MGRVVPFKIKNRFKNDFKSILSWVLQVGCFQSVRKIQTAENPEDSSNLDVNLTESIAAQPTFI